MQFIYGSREKFKTIVLFTGYVHAFPFMHADIDISAPRPGNYTKATNSDSGSNNNKALLNDLYIANLYDEVLFDCNLEVAYIGMHDLLYTNTLFM